MEVISISDEKSQDRNNPARKLVRLRANELCEILSINSSTVISNPIIVSAEEDHVSEENLFRNLIHSEPQNSQSKVRSWLYSCKDISDVVDIEEYGDINEGVQKFQGYSSSERMMAEKSRNGSILIRHDFNKPINLKSSLVSNDVQLKHIVPGHVVFNKDGDSNSKNAPSFQGREVCSVSSENSVNSRSKCTFVSRDNQCELKENVKKCISLSPESQQKNELCSYLQLMNMNIGIDKMRKLNHQRRSVRVQNLTLLSEKRKLEKLDMQLNSLTSKFNNTSERCDDKIHVDVGKKRTDKSDDGEQGNVLKKIYVRQKETDENKKEKQCKFLEKNMECGGKPVVEINSPVVESVEKGPVSLKDDGISNKSSTTINNTFVDSKLKLKRPKTQSQKAREREKKNYKRKKLKKKPRNNTLEYLIQRKYNKLLQMSKKDLESKSEEKVVERKVPDVQFKDIHTKTIAPKNVTLSCPNLTNITTNSHIFGEQNKIKNYNNDVDSISFTVKHLPKKLLNTQSHFDGVMLNFIKSENISIKNTRNSAICNELGKNCKRMTNESKIVQKMKRNFRCNRTVGMNLRSSGIKRTRTSDKLIAEVYGSTRRNGTLLKPKKSAKVRQKKSSNINADSKKGKTETTNVVTLKKTDPLITKRDLENITLYNPSVKSDILNRSLESAQTARSKYLSTDLIMEDQIRKLRLDSLTKCNNTNEEVINGSEKMLSKITQRRKSCISLRNNYIKPDVQRESQPLKNINYTEYVKSQIFQNKSFNVIDLSQSKLNVEPLTDHTYAIKSLTNKDYRMNVILGKWHNKMGEDLKSNNNINCTKQQDQRTNKISMERNPSTENEDLSGQDNFDDVKENTNEINLDKSATESNITKRIHVVSSPYGNISILEGKVSDCTRESKEINVCGDVPVGLKQIDLNAYCVGYNSHELLENLKNVSKDSINTADGTSSTIRENTEKNSSEQNETRIPTLNKSNQLKREEKVHGTLQISHVNDANSNLEKKVNYIPWNKSVDHKPLHKNLIQCKKKSHVKNVELTLKQLNTETEEKKSYSVNISDKDGLVMNAVYVNYNLVVVQEQLISFWTQSALGNMLGTQDMWISKGSIQRLSTNNNCVYQSSPEMVMSTENSMAYIELWIKEHKSDKRERPVADIFAAVYYFKQRPNSLDKKVLQLENINGLASDIQYVVLRNSYSVVVSWTETFENSKKTSIHCYDLAPDYQTIVYIKGMETVDHYISSLHNIEECDNLLMGCGDCKATVWNIEYGYVVATIDVTDIQSIFKTLWVKCDRGFLFILQHYELEKLFVLVAINGISQSWKRLQTFKVPNGLIGLQGVCIDNKILVAFFNNGVVCWNIQTGELVIEEMCSEITYIPSDKHVIMLTEGGVVVQHALSYFITSYDL